MKRRRDMRAEATSQMPASCTCTVRDGQHVHDLIVSTDVSDMGTIRAGGIVVRPVLKITVLPNPVMGICLSFLRQQCHARAMATCRSLWNAGQHSSASPTCVEITDQVVETSLVRLAPRYLRCRSRFIVGTLGPITHALTKQ